MKEVYLKNSTKETDKRYLLIHDGIYTKIKIDKKLFESLEEEVELVELETEEDIDKLLESLEEN